FTLFANESVRVVIETILTMDGDLFTPKGDIELTGSRDEAEAFLDNLERFRAAFQNDELLLINESLGFRQRVSIVDFYESELARRQRILERQGDPIADIEFRRRVEATAFCDTIETYP